MGEGVIEIKDDDDLETRLKDAGELLVVIDFFALWCGPCRQIAPKVQEMAKDMKDVVFIKVDVDVCESLATKYSIESLPTFVFIKNKEKLDSFTGANIDKLKEYIEKHK